MPGSAGRPSRGEERRRLCRLEAGSVALLLTMALAACGGPVRSGGATTAAGGGSSSTTSLGAGSTTASSTTTTSTTPATTTTTSSSTTTTTTTLPAGPEAAGRLPQTDVLPSGHSAQFHQEMRDLWRGIRGASLAAALPSFFPLSAYQRLKAIPDPTADWYERLLFDFKLDLSAAHRLLGAGASRARLLYVALPPGEQAWISPGYCYNSIGYWHLPGARVVYDEGGRVRSLGIASLISWRGQWYVVHLGAVLRSSAVGMVDDPASGRGSFGPPGGC